MSAKVYTKKGRRRENGFCRKFCVRARCATAGLSRLTLRERRTAPLDGVCPSFATALYGSCA